MSLHCEAVEDLRFRVFFLAAMQESFLSDLKEVKPDVCITAAYGNILPQRFLDIPPYGTSGTCCAFSLVFDCCCAQCRMIVSFSSRNSPLAKLIGNYCLIQWHIGKSAVIHMSCRQLRLIIFLDIYIFLLILNPILVLLRPSKTGVLKVSF
jgi:hypothetical protein